MYAHTHTYIYIYMYIYVYIYIYIYIISKIYSVRKLFNYFIIVTARLKKITILLKLKFQKITP